MEVLGNGKIKLLLKLTESIQDSKNFQKGPKNYTLFLIKKQHCSKKSSVGFLKRI